MMKKKRIGAILLSVALAVTQLPAVAMAKNIVPEDGSIASFMKLDSGVAKQTVPVGTAYEQLVLPDKVEAKVYHVTEDMVIPDKVNGGEADREGALGHEDEFEEETGGASTARAMRTEARQEMARGMKRTAGKRLRPSPRKWKKYP